MDNLTQASCALARIARRASCALVSGLLAASLVPAPAFAQNAEGGVAS